MLLWNEWFQVVLALRAACSRERTFLWMTVTLIGFSVRSELAGVTSFVRALGLHESSYPRLLHLFHSPALDLDRLTASWVRLAHTLFQPQRTAGRPVLVADGIKVPKEGLRMPAVKRLHQESGNNNKATYIYGHSFQAVGLLIQGPLKHVFCVPLASRIHEGLRASPSENKTLLDKLVKLVLEVSQDQPAGMILVADAYYASAKVIKPLVAHGHHLVTRVRRTTVAFEPAEQPKRPKRGRPRKYGAKLRLRDQWKDRNAFRSAPSPVYGETNVDVRYRTMDLLWRPVGEPVRFVLVDHPKRGRMILLTSDLSLEPLQVIRLYGYRFKIEVSFKQALRTLGTYGHHFWMSDMKRRANKSGDQYLHRTTHLYRAQIQRKMNAYHRYVQLGCIAQGILQHFAINYRKTVWTSFGSWLRTMHPDRPPSEAVVAQALRASLPQFLLGAEQDHTLVKFLRQRSWVDRWPELRATG